MRKISNSHIRIEQQTAEFIRKEKQNKLNQINKNEEHPSHRQNYPYWLENSFPIMIEPDGVARETDCCPIICCCAYDKFLWVSVIPPASGVRYCTRARTHNSVPGKVVVERVRARSRPVPYVCEMKNVYAMCLYLCGSDGGQHVCSIQLEHIHTQTHEHASHMECDTGRHFRWY